MPEQRHHSKRTIFGFLLLRFIVSVSYGGLLLWSAVKVMGADLEWWRALVVNIFAVSWVAHYEVTR